MWKYLGQVVLVLASLSSCSASEMVLEESYGSTGEEGHALRERGSAITVEVLAKLLQMDKAQRERDEKILDLLRSFQEEKLQSRVIALEDDAKAHQELAQDLRNRLDAIDIKVVELQASMATLSAVPEGLLTLHNRLEDVEVKADRPPKVETSLAALEGALQAHHTDAVQKLEKFQSRIASMEGVSKGNRNLLGDLRSYLEAVGNKVAMQSQAMTQLQGNHVSVKHHMETLNMQMEDVAQTLSLLRKDMKAVNGTGKRISSFKCRPPFRVVGEDCLYASEENLTWSNSRKLCQALGGDLVVPLHRELFTIHEPRYSGPRPHLINFLYEEVSNRSTGGLVFWLGASMSSKSTANWISGDKFPVPPNVFGNREPDPGGHCVDTVVWNDGGYTIGLPPCKAKRVAVCQLLPS